MPDLPDSSLVSITNVGSTLNDILTADDIRPGDEPSYQICKAIYIGHPLGAKMAEAPIRLAQADDREIVVPTGPEAVVEEWKEEWKRLEATRIILNVGTTARMYGIASVAMGEMENGKPRETVEPVKLSELHKYDLFFNVLDPLNTSGLIVDQDPNSPTFQKQRGDMHVAGRRWHRSRTCTMMNEESIYIAWTSSAFAFAGRSVYQRAFFPLKSFIKSMITDDMVVTKAGLLVAKMEAPGSIIDRTMKFFQGVRRSLLRQARTENVLSIGTTESIETLNMQNLDKAHSTARDNIIKNIATAADMPAKLLTQEAFVLGFGEGSEDAKAIAQYIDRVRIELQPLYDFFDIIVMYRAWNPDWYKTIQELYPETYADKPYEVAFQSWKNSFQATWPSLIKEEPSEAAKVDDINAQRALNVVQVMAPLVDPVNRARLIEWFEDQVNAMEHMFTGADLHFDMDELERHLEEQDEQQQQMGAGDQFEDQGLAQEEHSKFPSVGMDSARVSSLAGALALRQRRGDARRLLR